MHFNQVVSSGEPVIFEDLREGNWFENSFYPVLDESGKVVRVAAYIRDITEQRRVTEALRASEEKYRTLAEAAHDMIFIIDREDRIEYVNSFGAQFLGQPVQQLVGQPRAAFLPHPIPASTRRITSCKSSGPARRILQKAPIYSRIRRSG